MFAQGKHKLKTIAKVYAAALNEPYFASEPKYFILIDSAVNKVITRTDYHSYMEQFSNPARKGHPAKLFLDSSWLGFLKQVDIKRKLLTSFLLPKINSIHSIRAVKRDSIRLAFRTNINGWHGFLNVFGWAYGYFELSDVLLSKNKRKAIVEINHHIERSGAGCIFLLEKKKRKWILVNWMPVSIG